MEGLTGRRRAKLFAGRLVWRLERALGTRHLDEAIRQGRAVMGRRSYGEPILLTFGNDATRLIVGNFTSIARDATFVLGGNHRIDTVTTFPLAVTYGLETAGVDGQPWSKGDINIGSDVWIGARALVVSGVTIGHGAVVAAGATVTRDVRPFAVVAGTPAREVRRRFSDEQCEALLRIAWWNWSEEEVVDAYPGLSSTDVDAFVRQHRDKR